MLRIKGITLSFWALQKNEKAIIWMENQSVSLTWLFPFLLAAVREGIRECAGAVQLFHICYK